MRNTKVQLNHRQKISAGRFLAKKRMPYFSSALYSVIPMPVVGLQAQSGQPMACTPNGILIYDAQAVEAMELDDVEFSLLNVTSHLVRNSADVAKRNNWEPARANKALDASVNDDLMAAGCKPKPSDMIPSRIHEPKTMKPMEDGQTPHAYYRALAEMDDEPESEPGARPGGGNSGGCAGNPNPQEGAHGGSGKGNGGGQAKGKSPGRSEAEMNRMRKQVAKDVQKAAAKGHGNVPGGWQIWAGQELEPPKVRWQDKFRRVVRGAISSRKGMLDYSYCRPSRRQSGVGFGFGKPILPTMVAPEVEIVVAFDTSGSMSGDDLARAGAECRGILTQTDVTVHLLSCDAEVHGPPKKVKTWKEAQNSLKGGGGTDFGPIFEAVKGIKSKPSVLVILTDGGGPAPVRPPNGVTVVWVLIGEKTGGWAGAMVPWVEGESIETKVTYGEQIWVGN